MKIVRLTKGNLDECIEQSASVLRNGGIIAYPTETFYALGVRFDNESALKRIYELKNRPFDKTMPLLIGNISAVNKIARNINDLSYVLMKKYWPGPLTLILPSTPGMSEYVEKHGKVAVRVPGESFALHLARHLHYALTATSANPSGLPPAVTAIEVVSFFPDGIDLLIDGGETPGGLPSTIVEAIEGNIKILRQGAVRIEF